MAETKKETVLNLLNNAYNEYHIDYRENSITESYDFVIDTGRSRIFKKSVRNVGTILTALIFFEC